MENRKIRELYARWRFNADLMTCNECGYSVIATRMHETAHHAAGCQHEGERNPWMQLAEMLQAIKARDGVTATDGHCTLAEGKCNCGGDVPAVRAGCANWKTHNAEFSGQAASPRSSAGT